MHILKHTETYTLAHTRVYMYRHKYVHIHAPYIYLHTYMYTHDCKLKSAYTHFGVYPSTYSKESDRHTEHSEDSTYMGPFLVLEPLTRFQDRGSDCVSGSKPVLLWGTC